MTEDLKEDLSRCNPRFPSKKLKLTLPLPPSVNSMYINNRNGGKRLSKASQNYIRIAKALINQAIDDQRWVKQEDNTWFYIDIVFYMPDRRIRDSHNMIKLLLDVMQPIIYTNDYYVMPRIQSVEYDKEYPRLELCITPQSKKDRIKALQMTN